MRGFILIATPLLWFALPVAAEGPQAARVCELARQLPEHRRANFSKTPAPPLRFQRCWYQAPDQGGSVPASVTIGPGMEVNSYSVWHNRLRRSHNRILWQGRAFPGSIRGGVRSGELYRAYRSFHAAAATLGR